MLRMFYLSIMNVNTILMKTCPIVRINQKFFENLIRDELKGKYYPGFVKYFKSNSKHCQLRSAKSSQRSIDARIQGNTLFAKKVHNVDVHKDIWELYSKSIALAPIGSKELVLAYECRSNLLLHFKQYEDCIKDIDRALSITDFDPFKVKLLCRKMTCFVAMNKDVEEKKHLWDILKCRFEKTDDAFKNENFFKMIKQAKNDVCIEPNKLVKNERECSTFSDTFSNIVLEKRHWMATRDIQAGEVVIVTKPNITSVNPDKFYAYCSYCLSFMWAGVPCDECSSSMYCSEECKEKAWEEYHILECKVHSHIDFYHSIYYDFIASIKIFLMGVREYGSVSELLKKVREIDRLKDDPKLTKVDNMYESKFPNIYALPNKVISDSCTLSKLAKNACFLMAYLTQTLSEIFEKDVDTMKGKELSKDKDFVHCTYVMMKIMMLCGLNMQFPDKRRSMKACPKYGNPTDCLIKRCCSTGSAFYFFKGLMEKSCDPNISTCQTQDGKIIYFCIKPIKKMEMISAASTVPFYEADHIDRHSLILGGQKPSIYEVCQCIACVKNWPSAIVMFEKNEIRMKSHRRRTEVQTEVCNIVRKNSRRFHAKKCKDDPEKYFVYEPNEFQEHAKDTNTVFRICGQPSISSSLMITYLCDAFVNLHAALPMQSLIPKDC